jgi:hypothetical protein
MSIIAIAVVGTVAAVGAAAAKGAAANKAAKAMQKGWNATEPLDLDEMQEVGKAADLQKYQDQFAAQRKYDPVLGAMRSQGSENFLAQLQYDKTGQGVGDKATREVSKLIEDAKAGQQSAIDTLMTKAQEELDAGATLPPEFQAELVKAGLEGAGTGGLGIEGRGASGTGVRTLLGSAGLQLKQQREKNAIGMFGAADDIRAGRMKALAGVAELDNNVRSGKFARAGGAIGVGNAAMPSVGMSGATAMALTSANNDFENTRKLGKAGVEAARLKAQGDMWASIIGSVGSGMTGAVGGSYGGIMTKAAYDRQGA